MMYVCGIPLGVDNSSPDISGAVYETPLNVCKNRLYSKDNPSAPFGPGEPLLPVGPVGPVIPVGPKGPVLPNGTLHPHLLPSLLNG